MKRNLILCLIIILIVSCHQHKKTSVIITATLNGPSAMAMIKMIEEKPYLQGNISTEYMIRNEPNQVRAMLLEGKIDFAMVPSTMAALLYNIEESYILAAIPVWGTLYLFGTDTSIHSWKDLKGKKISLMARGMSPDIVFRFLAIRNGIDPEKDIVLDYSFPSHIELANAMAAEVSDLGVISEPLVSLVIKKNPSIKPLMDLNKEWNSIFCDSIPFAQTALVMKRKLADESPYLVEEYLTLLRESIDWVNKNPSDASRLIVKYNILPDTLTAIESIPRCNLKYSDAFSEIKGIQEYLKVFYNFNPMIIGGSIPDEKFFYKKQAD